MGNDQTVSCQIKPYIQPFERILALKELEALTGNKPSPISGQGENPLNFSVNSSISRDFLIDRLAYWESICDNGGLDKIITRQVRREATTTVLKNDSIPKDFRKVIPFNDRVPKVNRRNLRYGPHGIHEYRGKFFPQLVLSLLNIAGANFDSKILDPMCGSGTTLVESILTGFNALGIDLNPLSVFISRVKCEILAVKPDELENVYLRLREKILGFTDSKSQKLQWIKGLPQKDQEYLSNWFSGKALCQLDQLILLIGTTTNNIVCKSLFKVVLSNIIRKISWQKVDDLRVRKTVIDDANIDCFSDYVNELDKSVNSILAFLIENEGISLGKSDLFEGDSRLSTTYLKEYTGYVDAIITSPPYATALPYLDTDRLSLYYLGLLSRTDHHKRDYKMVGNREITNKKRQEYWDYYNQNCSLLTDDIIQLIDLIHKSNNTNQVGFRRKNLPSLLAKYFFDMRRILKSFTYLLRSGKPAFVVIGNNHTVSGDQRIEINTDDLLGQLGESVGLKLEEKLPMEMLVSRDIFKNNTGNAESILFFRNS